MNSVNFYFVWILFSTSPGHTDGKFYDRAVFSRNSEDCLISARALQQTYPKETYKCEKRKVNY